MGKFIFIIINVNFKKNIKITVVINMPEIVSASFVRILKGLLVIFVKRSNGVRSTC